MKQKIVFLLIFLNTPISIVAAAGVNGTEIVEFGIYEVETGERVEEKHAVTGYRSKPTRLVLREATNNVPAQQGMSFAAKFRLLGEKMGEKVLITAVTRFPEPGLTNPETGVLRRYSQSAIQSAVGRIFLHGYRLTQSWEVVPGDWALELYYEGRLIGRQAFTVGQP